MNERSGCYEVVFVGRVDALLTQIDRFREPSPALVGDVAGERSVGWFPLCRERAEIPLPVKRAAARFFNCGFRLLIHNLSLSDKELIAATNKK
jgi:hypothetical protein